MRARARASTGRGAAAAAARRPPDRRPRAPGDRRGRAGGGCAASRAGRSASDARGGRADCEGRRGAGGRLVARADAGVAAPRTRRRRRSAVADSRARLGGGRPHGRGGAHPPPRWEGGRRRRAQLRRAGGGERAARRLPSNERGVPNGRHGGRRSATAWRGSGMGAAGRRRGGGWDGRLAGGCLRQQTGCSRAGHADASPRCGPTVTAPVLCWPSIHPAGGSILADPPRPAGRPPGVCSLLACPPTCRRSSTACFGALPLRVQASVRHRRLPPLPPQHGR